MQTNEERMIELETKVSHQEIAIEDLQQGLFEQTATIQKLEKLVKELKERINGETSGGLDIGPGNEKPPHY
jgi:uncharacterized coiled-coil protein SlyX